MIDKVLTQKKTSPNPPTPLTSVFIFQTLAQNQTNFLSSFLNPRSEFFCHFIPQNPLQISLRFIAPRVSLFLSDLPPACSFSCSRRAARRSNALQ
jgi:hypothetical protein